MSQLPCFFYNGSLVKNDTVALEADTAKHIWQVLRMEAGDKITLTDGKGTIAVAGIRSAERSKCSVFVEEVRFQARSGGTLHLCVCFTKNNSRNEWLLEKASELGVASIIPVLAARSEKTQVRYERWEKILQSAILQSQQYYLPHLAEITPLAKVLDLYNGHSQKLIAHCIAGQERMPLSKMLNPEGEVVLLIGPEGDFTPDEVNLCVSRSFKPVSLGSQRLRTETAAITAAAYFNVMNDEQDR